MGCVCCCFRVPDVEEASSSSSTSSQITYSIIDCLINDMSNKGSTSTSSGMILNNPQFDTSRNLPNNLNHQSIPLENKFVDTGCGKGTNNSLLEPEQYIENDVLISKEINSELKSEVGYINSTSEEEDDVCPTCFEEYVTENPKIIAQCGHHYHLGCIYEWMERSENCPACGKLMVFDEST